MYKNNFDEVFERVYSAPEFARYTRQKRVSVVVKWVAYIGVFLFFIIIMQVSGNGLVDLRIAVFTLFWLFFCTSVLADSFQARQKSAVGRGVSFAVGERTGRLL